MFLQKNSQFTHEFVVSDIVYQGFIQTFQDQNPLHVNETFAQSKGFKDKVMHGNILNGFLSFFIGECLPLKNIIIHSQEMQYKNPVYLNDNLLFTADVVDYFESVNVAEFKFKFTNSENIVVAKGKINIGVI